jgi:hypothetical protein
MPHRSNRKGDLGNYRPKSSVADIDNIFLTEEGWVYRHFKGNPRDPKSRYWDEIIVAGQVDRDEERPSTNPIDYGTLIDNEPMLDTINATPRRYLGLGGTSEANSVDGYESDGVGYATDDIEFETVVSKRTIGATDGYFDYDYSHDTNLDGDGGGDGGDGGGGDGGGKRGPIGPTTEGPVFKGEGPNSYLYNLDPGQFLPSHYSVPTQYNKWVGNAATIAMTELDGAILTDFVLTDDPKLRFEIKDGDHVVDFTVTGINDGGYDGEDTHGNKFYSGPFFEVENADVSIVQWPEAEYEISYSGMAHS